MNSFYSQQAGCTVRWQDLPGFGDPVVFIHGLGCASSYEYPRIVCDTRFGGRRAILIDLPGSGYSDKPDIYRYRTSEQAQVVVELLNHLGLDSLWLYGHSMGGSIAIETATLLTSRVKGLIVSEPNFHAGGGMFSRAIAAQHRRLTVMSRDLLAASVPSPLLADREKFELLSLLMSLEAWQRLREQQGLSVEESRQAVLRAAKALIDCEA